MKTSSASHHWKGRPIIPSLRAAALLPILLAAVPGAAGLAAPLEIAARPVPLHGEDPERTSVGPLAFRGGLELGSADSRFGGLSALRISEDGARLTAVTDQGHWVTARLVAEADGAPRALAEAEIGELHGPGGRHLRAKGDADSESLTRLADGALVVGFERNHRLWRYPAGQNPLAGRPEPMPVPAGLAALRSNSGIEALATLADGALLAIAEGRKEHATSPAFLWRGGTWSELVYPRLPGFRPSGATTLPGGDLLVVERSFNLIDGVGIRLQRIAKAQIQAGATLSGTTLAVLRPPLTLDNMEGVAARRAKTGETLLYLVSDDNFRPLQRTLLLVFALEE
jgi:hypothetical protein